MIDKGFGFVVELLGVVYSGPTDPKVTCHHGGIVTGFDECNDFLTKLFHFCILVFLKDLRLIYFLRSKRKSVFC
uniref:Uncharacterized protein n=1 Tax=Lepeophtheirus salmonis TaxID=72036 RepID=A0A0K2TQ63_LEPSM